KRKAAGEGKGEIFGGARIIKKKRKRNAHGSGCALSMQSGSADGCTCPDRIAGPCPAERRVDQSANRVCFFFQAEDGIRDWSVTGVQTCALPIRGASRITPSTAPSAECRAMPS